MHAVYTTKKKTWSKNTTTKNCEFKSQLSILEPIKIQNCVF